MPMSRKNFVFFAAPILAIVLIVFFIHPDLKWDEKDHTGSSSENLMNAVAQQTNDDHVLWEGSDDVVVIEYFDLDCPYCRALLLEEDKIPDDIKKNVRLVYRWFPLLELYPQALDHAIIAECVSMAAGETAFFDFLRTISDSYEEHKEKNQWLVETASQFVEDDGYFDQCVSEKLSLEKINRFRAGGHAAGIFSVPSFLVAEKGMSIRKFDLLGPISGSRLLSKYAAQEESAP